LRFIATVVEDVLMTSQIDSFQWYAKAPVTGLDLMN
jgi:hypothetical protein